MPHIRTPGRGQWKAFGVQRSGDDERIPPLHSRHFRRRSGWLLACVMLLAAGAAIAAKAPPTVIWMTATMDGRKVGHLHYVRSTQGDRVVTDSTLDIRFARTDKPLQIRNTVREVESTSGEPLDFSSTTQMSSVHSSAVGTRTEPGVFRVRVHVGSRTRSYDLTWPRDALFNNGMRKAIVAHGFRPGTRYSLRRFDSSSQSASLLQMEVVGPQDVELPGGVHRLTHIRQTRKDIRTTQVTDLWVDSRGELLKIGMPLLGFRLELLACSETCAMQPPQDVNVLKRAMVKVPRPLPQVLRESPLRFVFRVPEVRESPFIATDMQRVSKFGRNIWVIDTIPGRKGVDRPPTSSDTAATDWLQSDAPEIIALAQKASRGATTDNTRMLRMTQFVREYMTEEGPSVGYASALETLHSRHGDCTEHAVLLAAMARAMHIPARVITGLAYSSRYAGQDGVLVPHTWVQAWVGGTWKEFDAALPRYDRTHIAMDVGNGDPWKYFNGINSLGRIELLRVQPGANIGEGRPVAPPVPPAGGGRGGGTDGGGR